MVIFASKFFLRCADDRVDEKWQAYYADERKIFNYRISYVVCVHDVTAFRIESIKLIRRLTTWMFNLFP